MVGRAQGRKNGRGAPAGLGLRGPSRRSGPKRVSAPRLRCFQRGLLSSTQSWLLLLLLAVAALVAGVS